MLQRIEDIDAALVDRLQHSAFKYFLKYSNPENGLVPDTSIPGVPASIAAVGFGLSSYPVGVERGWISREEAAERVFNTLHFFANAKQGTERHATGHRGFFYHFLHVDTGNRAWNSELSTIDTALLIAGILTAAQYFDGEDQTETEIRALATFIYERVDWRWALNKGDSSRWAGSLLPASCAGAITASTRRSSSIRWRWHRRRIRSRSRPMMPSRQAIRG